MLDIWGILWLVFGSGAVITAILNIFRTIKGRDAKWYRFISISLTALTLCSFYSQAGVWALRNDWSALEDVVPSVSVILWVLTLISIVLNSISLLKKNR